MTEVVSLYKGEVTLEFDEPSHSYTVNGKAVPSVTSITKIIDKSGPLMGWAVNQAIRYLESEWPANSVVTPQQKGKILRGAAKAYRSSQNAAAQIGTEVHNYIEAYIKHRLYLEPPPVGPSSIEAFRAIEAFDGWINQHHVEFIKSEKFVYSRDLDYTGKLDLIAKVDGVLTLIDFKTSKAFYKEHALQVAAYVMAENEERGFLGDNERIRDRMIILLGKESADFKVVSLPRDQLRSDQEGFVSARKLAKWIENVSLNKTYSYAGF